ncbi:autotransporter-associated beta strand repeat-containing protein [Bradyrhizobium sp.]|uniref:beta strand repeat-containing protein n=1 Tax=Bradyrhizobium sp. TaxID=376 RepID=UPI00271AE127|nr:autotransporter-associated beta strand repeat-containing protein [Bradyrhizobium sp.]MDO9297524.1 autotransporter-associated beta strand repeat-containing protein [Bradyrhizobium sp.]
MKATNQHKILLALAAAAALATGASTMAAAKDWSNGTGGNWNENRNWDGVVKFRQGDSAKFPASSSSPSVSVVNFDLAPGTDVNGIAFAGGSWKIQGNTMDLGGGITSAGNNEVSCLIQIFPGVVFSSSSGQLRLANISLLGRTATFSVNTGAKIASAVISGPGTTSKIVKTGGGSLVMNGASTYQGTTTVQAGVLEGVGTVPNVVLAGGTMSPGDSNSAFGTMTVTGLTATSASVLKFNVGANQSGQLTGQDQLVLTGAANLDGITLDTDYSRPIGAADFVKREIILISKTSPGFVSGTFAGLPEGGLVSFDAVAMEISYRGGVGGNDVVLRPRTQPATLTWKLSNSSLWSDSASWTGGGPVEPAAGDRLVFPDLTGLEHHPNATNDLTNAVIDTITINSNSYAIGGGSFRLKTGITQNDFTPNNTVNRTNTVAGVTADNAIFIRNNNNNATGMLLVALGINANNRAVTVDGNGVTATRISLQPGGGNLIKSGSILLDLFDSQQFTGSITVNEGRMRLFGNLGTAAAGTTINGAGTLEIVATAGAASPSGLGGIVPEPITLNGGTLSTVGGFFVTFTGPITTTSPTSALQASFAPSDNIAEQAVQIDTSITGSGGLRLINGAARFLQPTTFTNPMLVQNGYAIFLSTHTSSPIIGGTDPGVETNSGPFVMGTGTVGAVTIDNGARLDPGPLLRTVGTLTMNGALTFGTGGNYFATVDTSSADQAAVTGSVTVGGRLVPITAAGFAAALNTTFVIIDNDGADPVIGKFSGTDGSTTTTAQVTLNEGALVRGLNPDQASQPVFSISYVGGTGNDVTLTLVSN